MQPSSQISRSLDDIQTELLLQSFADRVLVLITQVGKVGNLIQATIPSTAPLIPQSSSSSDQNDLVASDAMQSLPSPPPSVQLTPLLGSAPSEHIQTLHSLYASQVATLIWLSEESRGGERKPVVVGIALKKAGAWDEAKERRTFKNVMQMLNELLGAASRKAGRQETT